MGLDWSKPRRGPGGHVTTKARTPHPRTPILVPSSTWDATVWRRLAPLASTARVAEALAQHTDFPTTDELTALVQGQCSADGARLSFERQTKKIRVTELSQAYDARIYHHGLVPTRERSWHDLFNALVWLAFPRAKASVNTRQFDALVARFRALGKMPAARTREQDALAMLDEGGLLLTTSAAQEPFLRRALTTNDQRALHALVARGEVCTLVFGHALAEHVVSSDAPVRGLPVPLIIPPAAFAGRATLSPAFLAAVDRALADLLAGPFGRAAEGESALGGVVAIDLRPELFAAPLAPPPRTAGPGV